MLNLSTPPEPSPVLMGWQKVGGVQEVRFSTPSVSPPILGEKRNIDVFICVLIRPRTRCEDAQSV